MFQAVIVYFAPGKAKSNKVGVINSYTSLLQRSMMHSLKLVHNVLSVGVYFQVKSYGCKKEKCFL